MTLNIWTAIARLVDTEWQWSLFVGVWMRVKKVPQPLLILLLVSLTVPSVARSSSPRRVAQPIWNAAPQKWALLRLYCCRLCIDKLKRPIMSPLPTDCESVSQESTFNIPLGTVGCDIWCCSMYFWDNSKRRLNITWSCLHCLPIFYTIGIAYLSPNISICVLTKLNQISFIIFPLAQKLEAQKGKVCPSRVSKQGRSPERRLNFRTKTPWWPWLCPLPCWNRVGGQREHYKWIPLPLTSPLLLCWTGGHMQVH